MNLYKIAVCDSDAVCNIELISMLHSIAEEEKIAIAVDVYKTYENFEENFNENKYNLLFIESLNNGVLGIDAVKRFHCKYRNFETEIVFVSKNDKYALPSFEVFPIGYLLKPYKKNKVRIPFCHAVNKQCGKKSVALKSMEGGNIVIGVDELLYIEVIGTELDVRTVYGKYQCIGALSDVYLQLPAGQFYRAHRSFIVSLRHVLKIDKYFFIMINGDRVAIAKNRFAQAKEIFSKYIGLIP